jgi:hypothetical protein
MCQPAFHQAALAKDVKAELDAALGTLAGKGKGKGAKKLRGLERKKMWEDVRALRKECVFGCSVILTSLIGDVPQVSTERGRGCESGPLRVPGTYQPVPD